MNKKEVFLLVLVALLLGCCVTLLVRAQAPNGQASQQPIPTRPRGAIALSKDVADKLIQQQGRAQKEIDRLTELKHDTCTSVGLVVSCEPGVDSAGMYVAVGDPESKAQASNPTIPSSPQAQGAKP